MHAALGGVGSPGAGQQSGDMSSFLEYKVLGDLASQSTSTVRLLSILAMHQQKKAALGEP